MQISLPRYYSKRIWRAIIEFELMAAGDRILVGFSGGKDSLFLLYALRALQAKSPFPFALGAVHVDLGFTQPSAADELAGVCDELEVPFYLQSTGIADRALGAESRNSCAVCAYFRRAVVNKTALAQGYNKVAWGHHHDDAVETLLLSQLYGGQLQTFLPCVTLERSGLTVIRPLVYLREAKIQEYVRELPWQPMASRCPLRGRTHRWKVKTLVQALTRENPSVYSNLAACMRDGGNICLWPALPNQEEMGKKHVRIMGGGTEGGVDLAPSKGGKEKSAISRPLRDVGEVNEDNGTL